MRLVPAGLAGRAPAVGHGVPERPDGVLQPDDRDHRARSGQRSLGEGAGVVRGALDGHQVGPDVTARDQVAVVVPAPDLPGEQSRLEVGAAGAVLGEGVDHRVAPGEREEVRQVGGPEHAHSLARAEPGQGHALSLRGCGLARTRPPPPILPGGHAGVVQEAVKTSAPKVAGPGPRVAEPGQPEEVLDRGQQRVVVVAAVGDRARHDVRREDERADPASTGSADAGPPALGPAPSPQQALESSCTPSDSSAVITSIPSAGRPASAGSAAPRSCIQAFTARSPPGPPSAQVGSWPSWHRSGVM